ncbi:hypothetical protein ACUN3I_21240 [Hafnia alvei]|uniref:hypothetical protein n=1 Tax=Hafnia alvei TaxID=569 RepID=UPI004044E146
MRSGELEALYKSAINFVFSIGKFNADYLKKGLQIDDSDLNQLIDKMISHGAISDIDESGHYTPLRTYIHSDYLLQQELKDDAEKVKVNCEKKAAAKLNKSIVMLAIAIFLLACFFALREPISLVFIIGSFLIIGCGFGKVSEMAEVNSRLSLAEKNRTLRFCSVGFLVLSITANIGFLFWVNSKTPIWGDRYAERLQSEALIDAAKQEKRSQDERRIIAVSNAEASVKSNLKDPSSAKFSIGRVGKDGFVCGTVNAKNSFGAYSGNSRYVSSGGKAAIDDGSQEFSRLWNSKCN